MIFRTAALAAALLAAACQTAPEPPSTPAPAAIAAPMPSATIRYGAAEAQRIELFLPPGRGPHPVVIFIHGGCYVTAPGQGELADLRPAYAALAQRGVAVWGIGYRRTNEAGGAYPGLFADIAAATDRLPAEARRFQLDMTRVVIAGHSAGGHLALWDAARPRLPSGHPLRPERPLAPLAVINLAGPTDIAPLRAGMNKLCGPMTYERLVGEPSAERADPLADTSPARLAPIGVRTLQFIGSADVVVAPATLVAYDALASAAGDDVSTRIIPGARHIDVVRPGAPAFAQVMDAIIAALRVRTADEG